MKLRNLINEDKIDDRTERMRNSLENDPELQDDTASDLYNNSATGERQKPTSRPVGDYSNPFENTMKLTDIAKTALKEAESKAAEQAHHLGLTAAGYGNWKDNSGNVVAKSVKGGEALIQTKPEDDMTGTEPEETDELPEPSASDIEEPEDLLSPETPVETPDDEYVPAPSAVIPDAPIGGGDVSRALSILAKKFHDAQGNPERQAVIKAQIDKVQAAEAAETQHMVDALAAVQARKDAQKQAAREKMAKNPKYASLLNNPNKGL